MKGSTVVLRLLHHLRRSSRAAIDLASIMVGVLVVGILSAGAGFALLGAIPWAQDSAAKNVLIGVAAAEEAAAKLDGGYVNYAGLITMGLVQTDPKVSAGTGTPSDPGTCFVAGVASDSGKKFYITNRMDEPQEWTGQDTSWCFDFPELGLTPAVPSDPFANVAATDRSGTPKAYWRAVATSANGKYVYAAPSDPKSLYRSEDKGQSWQPVTSAGSRAWYGISTSSNGKYVAAVVSSGYVYTSDDYGKSFTERQSSGTQTWRTVVISDDGQNIVAGVSGAAPYTSKDGGATWSTYAPNGSYYASDISEDGKTIVGVIFNGFLYVSTDSGTTWSAPATAGSRGWYDVDMSKDGKYMAAVASSGSVYTSDDFGKTWTAKASAGTQLWRTVVISDDGQNIVAGVSGAAPYASKDGGATWSTYAPNGTYYASDISEDGTFIIGGIYGGGIYTSTNSGANWTLQANAGTTRNWTDIDVSSDGQNIVAVAYNSNIFTSTDYGVTWTARTTPSTQYWKGVTTSDDGQHIVATVSSGAIWWSADGGATFQTGAGAPLTGKGYAGVDASPDGKNVVVGGGPSGFSYKSTDYGQTWTTAGLTNTPSGTWWVATSDDGQNMVAANSATSHGITRSVNGGASWSPVTAPFATMSITSVASSSDGSKVAVTVDTGYIFLSEDSGATWAQQTSSGKRDWKNVTMNSAGTKLTATDNTSTATQLGQIWLSTDGGKLWRAGIVTNRGFGNLIMSGDGKSIIGGAALYGYMYRSIDGGVTWNQLPLGNASPSSYWSIGSSTDGNTLVAGNWDNGMGLYRSTNAGTTWATLTVPWGTSRVTSVATSGDGSKIAVTLDASYIFTSDDSGVTWTQQTSSGKRDWKSINMNTAGTKLTAADNTSTSTQSGQTWVSSDGGKLWTAGIVTNRGFSSLTMSGDGKSIIGGASTYGYMYRSIDGGITWNQLPFGNASPPSGWSVGSSADGNTLVAGNGDVGYGLYRSTNAGLSWTVLTVPWASKRLTAVATSADGTKITVTIDAEYLYTSSDSGATWTQRKTAGVRDWYALAMTPDASTIYAGATTDFVYVNTDNGATWRTGVGATSFNAVAISGDGRKQVAVDSATTRQAYLSNDFGATWQSVKPGITGGSWQDVAMSSDGNIIYAVNSSALPFAHKSVDGGATWAPLGTVPWTTYAKMVTTSANGNKVVVALGSGDIYYSTDAGATWTKSNSGSKSWRSMESSADGAVLVASTTATNVGVYVSTDFGATWTARGANDNYLAVAASGDGKKLFAAPSGKALIVSTDNGGSWQTLASGAKVWQALGVNDDGSKIVAATNEVKLYASKDSGVGWQALTVAGMTTTMTNVTLSPDGKHATVTSSGGVGLATIDYSK